MWILAATGTVLLIKMLVATFAIWGVAVSFLFYGWVGAAIVRSTAQALHDRLHLNYKIGAALAFLTLYSALAILIADWMILAIPAMVDAAQPIAYDYADWIESLDVSEPWSMFVDLLIAMSLDEYIIESSIAVVLSDSAHRLLILSTVWLPTVVFVALVLVISWKWLAEWLERLLPATWRAEGPNSFASLQFAYLRWLARTGIVGVLYSWVVLAVLLKTSTPMPFYIAMIAGGFTVIPFIGGILAMALPILAIFLFADLPLIEVLTLGGVLIAADSVIKILVWSRLRSPKGKGLPLLIFVPTLLAFCFVDLVDFMMAFLVIPPAGFVYFAGRGLGARIDAHKAITDINNPRP